MPHPAFRPWVSDLISVDPSYYIANQLAFGRSVDDLGPGWQTILQYADPDDVASWIERALAMHRSGIIGTNEPGRNVPPSRIPINPGLPDTYRYVTIWECTDAITGRTHNVTYVEDRGDRASFNVLSSELASTILDAIRSGETYPLEMMMHEQDCRMVSISSVERNG